MVTLGLFQEPRLVSRVYPGGCEHPTSTRSWKHRPYGRPRSAVTNGTGRGRVGVFRTRL